MNLPFALDLSGKTVVVTGAGGVLCSCFAEAAARCGAKTALLDLNLEAAERCAAAIREAGFEAKAYQVNVLEKTTVEAAREAILQDFGPCDILINGAGGNNPRANTTKDYYLPDDPDDSVVTFFDLDPKGVEFVFNLNFLGTLLPTQVFARDMVGREGAAIINISSMNAFTPLTRIPAYSGAKAAVSNFTQWLATHFSKAGIRVNAIAPGFFLTNQNRGLMVNPDGSPSARAEKILAGTPMGRFGEPEELLGALEFLMNDKASSFVNGVVIPVDGGFNAYSGV
ncbi:MAG: SDR family oxidoreductase [Oscillospiraceae bacterium]|jgi:NAD(P)-dependent dehydrogenase (short-subunit alcohol dehydrogenase family)|nr:SDR family oxidoreductase [Oscillospiraceae bacterium]